MNTTKFPYKRIAVIGTTGSGKTTLAGEIGACLNIPVHSLDKFQKDEAGHNLDFPEFIKRVDAITSEASWIIDGCYKITNPIVLKTAQAVIRLDYPLRIVLPRRIKRNLSQSFVNPFISPKKFAHRIENLVHLVRKTIRKHSQLKKDYQSLSVDYPRIKILHFTNPHLTRIWLEGLHK